MEIQIGRNREREIEREREEISEDDGDGGHLIVVEGSARRKKEYVIPMP